MITIEPKEGLRADAQGGVIQNSGCGDEKYQILVADETEFNSTAFDSSVLDIRNVSQILLGVFLEDLGSGGSPNIRLDCIIEFSDTVQAIWHRLIAGTISSGVIASPVGIFRFTTEDIHYLIPIPNPGATHMRVRILGTQASPGTAKMGIRALRGWGSSPLNVN